MTFFDPDDVELLRADVEDASPETCTINRPQTTDGGTATTYTPIATRVPCGVRGAVSREVVIEGETRRIPVLPVTLPPDTEVPEGAQLVIGARTLRVVGREGPGSAAFAASLVVFCLELN